MKKLNKRNKNVSNTIQAYADACGCSCVSCYCVSPAQNAGGTSMAQYSSLFSSYR